MTKTQMEMRIAELTRQVDKLHNTLQAINHRKYNLEGRYDSVILPLADTERDAVLEFVRNAVMEQACNGRRVSPQPETVDDLQSGVWEDEIHWRYEMLLPRFDALYVRYSYDRQNGTDVEGVWGIIKV